VSARHKARKRALDFLFEGDIRKLDPYELFSNREKSDISEQEYAGEILQGVAAHKDKIDELIISYAEGWDLDRMPAVDRNILRVALFEMFWSASVPNDVVISEALLLSDENSTSESTKYINGVLSRILALKPSLNIN
jgi:N utilization substance protein B